ncbi:MAG: glycosyltransferase family 2 protein [Nocardioides sp.]
MPSPDSQRIVAVVVTFNRLDLLQGLVAALTQEPKLTSVVVVDNASTDGTGAWLAERAAVSSGVPVDVVLLSDNTGGAGGFKAGMERAVELAADLVWLMDDDGLPEPGCLDLLLEYRDRLDFWGPVVVDRADPERLVFPIRLPGGARTVRRLPDVAAAARTSGDPGILEDVVIPFNGVLVTADLIGRIGTVRADYFIWGDDHEYRLRAEKSGARIATVVGAKVLHPTVGELGTPMAFGKTTYNHSPSDLKHYCMARNNLLNLRDYNGWPHALAFVAKTVWFYTFTRPDPARLRLSFQAMRAGLRGDFTGHRRFLGGGGS